MSIIGDRMRELRGPSSLREMADAVGIKFNAWARYESGDVLPGAEIITKICKAHAVSADWLLGIDEKSRGSVIASAPHAIAVSGNHISVKGASSCACSKCPLKKKFKALEKVFQSI